MTEQTDNSNETPAEALKRVLAAKKAGAKAGKGGAFKPGQHPEKAASASTLAGSPRASISSSVALYSPTPTANRATDEPYSASVAATLVARAALSVAPPSVTVTTTGCCPQ
jgi:hypothetical protein